AISCARHPFTASTAVREKLLARFRPVVYCRSELGGEPGKSTGSAWGCVMTLLMLRDGVCLSRCRHILDRIGLLLATGALAMTMTAWPAAAQDSGAAGGTAGGTLAQNGPAIGVLPHDLSPWSMFLAADVIVKLVMIS